MIPYNFNGFNFKSSSIIAVYSTHSATSWMSNTLAKDVILLIIYFLYLPRVTPPFIFTEEVMWPVC